MKIFKEWLLSESSDLKEIPINIWDDYLDAESQPENPIPETGTKVASYEGDDTHAYVESSDISLEVEKEALSLLSSYMNANGCTTQVVKSPMESKEAGWRYQLKIYNMSHDKRKEIVSDLKGGKLKVDGIRLNIYSES